MSPAHLSTSKDSAARLQAQAEAVFYSIGDGAIAIDIDGRISNLNHVAQELLGFSEEEAIGQWFPGLVVAQDEKGRKTPEIDRPISRAFLTGKTVSEKTFYVTKSGHILPVDITVSPVMFEGQLIGAVEVFRDITHESNVDSMKNEFVSIASHQLRTPLSAIKTYTHLLSEGYVGPLTPPQKEIAETILGSIERMNELIDTLLDVAKLERGKLGVNKQPSDLSQLLKSLVSEIGQSASDKQIYLSADIQKDVTAKTDPLLVKEVFANLLTNAIKYTGKGGKVEVSLRSSGRQAVFRVTDTGYGIPRRFHDRIYTKFFRAPNIMQQETSGTGLGLYMVKSIADALEGKLSFESEENQGTTFVFSLPAYKPPGDKSGKRITAKGV